MDTEKTIDQEIYNTYLNSDIKTILSQSLSVTEHVKKLGEGIETLNKELQKQVLEHHDDLLRQANHAVKLENVLSIINMHVQNLFANAERLRAQITNPYKALEQHTRVLRNLNSASHILRQLSRMQQLSKRLSNTNDPVQKAAILQDLEQLVTDPDLTDIDAVTTELRNIRLQKQNLVKLASGSLHQGIINENYIQTSVALQVFMNLGTANGTVQDLIKQNLSECREIIKMALKISTATISKVKGGPGRVSLSTSQDFRNKMWTELDNSFSEDIYNICKHMKFLFSTLDEMHLKVIDNMASKFWTGFISIIQEEIVESSPAIRQGLEDDYPKFLKLYCEMLKKLNYNHFKFDSDLLRKLENSYLSNSLSRMSQPVQAMFATESIMPSHDEIDNLIRIITNELSVALVEENLSDNISKNVAKCIKMFAAKMEQKIENGTDTAQVIGGSPNALQQKNVQYSNSLYYMQTKTQRMLANMKGTLSESGVSIIEESLLCLNILSGAIIQPLVTSINSVIETIIITIHLEKDWSKTQSNKSQSCSPYMRELSQFINRVYHTYLENFQNKEVLIQKCNEIALRCIDLFIRHSIILRPISQGGRQKLQNDYNHLEQALKVICPNLADLGQQYRILKSMSSLITLSPEEIVAGQSSGSSVPHSIILLMLFSYAGSEVASPHQNTGWSLQKLSNWLDEHPSESDRLDLVAGALQKYEAQVRQKNSTNYDPAYPVMSSFLEKALKEINI